MDGIFSGGYPIIVNEPSFAFCYSNWLAGFGGYDNAIDWTYQDLTIPSSATQAYLRFAYRILTAESGTSPYDSMMIELLNPNDNTVLTTLVTLSNVDDTSGYYYFSAKYDLSLYIGETIRLRFHSTTDFSYPTLFLVDDVVLSVLLSTPPQTLK